jgi:hypothetical protein
VHYGNRRYGSRPTFRAMKTVQTASVGNEENKYEREKAVRCTGMNAPWIAIPFRREDAASNYAKHRSRSHDAVIRVYDAAGDVVETHEHAGDFKEW